MVTPIAVNENYPSQQLHYVYDPFCGWCYGASQLIAKAHAILPIRLYGAGMFTGPRRQALNAEFRDVVLRHDQRIHALTGQAFSKEYRQKLLFDTTVLLDSGLVIAAIDLVHASTGRGLEFLQHMQATYYVDGKNSSDLEFLGKAAQQFGLSQTEIDLCLQDSTAITKAMHAARLFMQGHDVHGFPTLLLERNSEWQTLPLSDYLGRPEEFAAHLQTLVRA